MKLRLLKTDDSLVLAYLMQMMRDEIFGSKETIDVDSFITSHDYIYLLVIKEKVVGFSSYAITNNFGISEKKLINSFLFIEKEYRKTKALTLFIMQTGKIIETLGINVQFPTNSNELVGIFGKLNTKIVYNVGEYSVSDYHIEKKKLSKLLYRKETT